MSDLSKTERRPQISVPSRASVDALATRALSMVAKRNSKTTPQYDHDFSNRLRDAAADGEREDVIDLIQEMLGAQISPEVIATQYIPHVARQLGDEWCEDTLSFARVTIGTARLQSALRSLGKDWSSRGHDDENNRHASVIVIVARDSHHTLGAMVLSGQLRRMGLSVRLAIGATTEELQTLFLTSAFDAALISASVAESLDSLRKCVDIIKKSASSCPPIVIGGGVLDQDADVKALTGADYTTLNPIEALEFCGLTREMCRPTLNVAMRG